MAPGQALEIRLSNTGVETDFDNVRLVVSGVETYAYDPEGNRLGASGNSQSPDGNHNRLTTDGTYNYTHDNESNTIQRTRISNNSVTNYTWDHRNRLTRVEERVAVSWPITKAVNYAYDAFDRRTFKVLDADGNGSLDK